MRLGDLTGFPPETELVERRTGGMRSHTSRTASFLLQAITSRL